MSDKFLSLTAPVYEYLLAHQGPRHPVQDELIAATRALGPAAIMQVAPEQGAFLTLLTRLLGVRRAIEVGTFTGYSALSIALGLPEDGRLLCCDVNEEWTSVARAHWARAGVADRIELRLGPAADTLRSLPPEESFDLAFIDADKTGYRTYYEEILARLRPNGILLIDNVLWNGSVADPDVDDEDTVVLRQLNDFLRDDPRVEVVMLAVADGLTLARKRQEEWG